MADDKIEVEMIDQCALQKYPFIRKKQKNGVLYILTNDEYESRSCYKVGMSRRSADERVAQMNTGRRMSDSLHIAYTHNTEFVKMAEKMVHMILDKWRDDKRREFFICDLDIIKRTIQYVSESMNQMMTFKNRL